MQYRKLVGRLIATLFGAASLLVAAMGVILAYPEPLYAYHVEHGRLRLYSDRPFDADKGRAVLDRVERALASAPAELRDPTSVYRVFVTTDEWRKRLVFLWNYGVGGVNYYPIAGSVFIRQADIDRDRVLRSDGEAVPLPRTLTYYAGHEIGHSLIGRRVGALANWRMPAWIREGMSDYLAFGGEVDLEALTDAWRAGDPDLDPKQSGTYARYRMLVAYFLKHEGWSVDRLLASRLKLADAERMLDAGMPPG